MPSGSERFRQVAAWLDHVAQRPQAARVINIDVRGVDEWRAYANVEGLESLLSGTLDGLFVPEVVRWRAAAARAVDCFDAAVSRLRDGRNVEWWVPPSNAKRYTCHVFARDPAEGGALWGLRGFGKGRMNHGHGHSYGCGADQL